MRKRNQFEMFLLCAKKALATMEKGGVIAARATEHETRMAYADALAYVTALEDVLAAEPDGIYGVCGYFYRCRELKRDLKRGRK